MFDTLNVLLVESEPGAAVMAEHELAQRGHTVLRCHEAGAAAFPCNALQEGRRCPFEGRAVDVALDVRRRPRSEPTGLEDGIACALRRHIPVVVAGSSVMNPYADYATEVLERTFDVVESCERAARGPLPQHTAAAAAALRSVLERRRITSPAHVTVRRWRGALVVSVRGGDDLDAATRSAAAARMTGAVRAIDPDARGIDVVFGNSGSPHSTARLENL